MTVSVYSRSDKLLATIPVPEKISVKELKKQICSHMGGGLYPERVQLKGDKAGKPLDDKQVLDSSTVKVYFRDLGPQIGWKTVFLAEYAGPLFVYLIFYARPSFIYGSSKIAASPVQHLAAFCWSLHYIKRLLETVFIHRFSHATMPFFNLFKNCSYYWGFAAYIAYYVNHPMFTEPTSMWVTIGAIGFLICEYGNFAIHVALRNLRPANTTTRRIPVATSNPMTLLFNYVSCANYTYEVGAWFSFFIMTSCLPALFFCIGGFAQMAEWARGKHRNYKKEFPDYPKHRKAIVPFLY